MSDDDIWRTPSFRQNVVNKMYIYNSLLILYSRIFQKLLYISFFSDEAIAQSGMPTSKNSLEMENHVYMKAKSKVSNTLLVNHN